MDRDTDAHRAEVKVRMGITTRVSSVYIQQVEIRGYGEDSSTFRGGNASARDDPDPMWITVAAGDELTYCES